MNLKAISEIFGMVNQAKDNVVKSLTHPITKQEIILITVQDAIKFGVIKE